MASNMWIPSPREDEYIESWFDYLDEKDEEKVGGAKIVHFLVQSGLEKGTLREIWELGDREKKGWVNKDQFTLIIRLVSLACSPRFEGKSPSIEIYQETITDRVPLPYSLIDACEATKELTMSKPIMERGVDDATKRRPSGGNASPGGRMRANSGERGDVSPGGPRRRSSSGDKMTPTRRRSSGSKRRDSFDIEWLPSLSEEKQIDKWFDGLDTDPKNAQIGGAKIVHFLVQSGLEKGTLREIWELGDREKKGWVNKKQFMLIMRLVAIAVAGQSPTLEKYKATITNSYSFPLPQLALPSEGAALTTAIPGGDAVTASASASATASTPSVVQPMGVPPVGAMATGPGSAMAGTGSGLVEGQWIPPLDESLALDRWYTALDEGRVQRVGGASIVGFLMKSGIPKDQLRTIWSLGDTGGKGWVSRAEFAVIIRLVAICKAQGGVPSMERYYSTRGDTTIPLPPLGDEPTPAPAPAMGLGGSSSTTMDSTGGGGGTSAWVPSPPEAAKIDEWFSSMAAGSPTIGGAKIVPFLLKSGAPKHVLRECWAIGDADSSGSVDKAQFTVIVRLVMLCLADLSRGGSGVPSMDAYYSSSLDSTLPLPPLGLDLGEEERKIESIILSNMSALSSGTGTGTVTTAEEDEFGDFGDFSEAPDTSTGAPAPASAPVPMGMGAFDTMGPPSSETGPTSAANTSAIIGAPGGLGLGATMGLPSLHTVTPGQGQGQGQGQEEEDDEFGDFSAVEGQGAEARSASWDAFDSMGGTRSSTDASLPPAPVSAPSPPPAAPPIPDFGPVSPAATHKEPPSALSALSVDPNPVTTAGALDTSANTSSGSSLSTAQLAALSQTLLDRHHYEHAYLAALQMDTLQRLQSLGARKTAAVANDDLETAVQCKREIAAASAELCSPEEEQACKASAAADAGTSLAASAELLESLDPAAGSRCRLAFLNRPLASSDTLAETRFHLQAQRTLRLLIALRTTHAGYDQVWPGLLTSIHAQLQAGQSKQAPRFQALSPAERVQALEDERLSAYARGIVKVAELGLYLAATVLECGPVGALQESHIDLAREMESLAHSVLLEARQLWGTGSPLALGAVGAGGGAGSDPIEVLQSQALACSARGVPVSGSGVHYCGLTLRPVARGTVALDSQCPVTQLQGQWYLQCAVDYYRHEVAPSLPETSGVFQ